MTPDPEEWVCVSTWPSGDNLKHISRGATQGHISHADSNSKSLNSGVEKGHEMVYSWQKISTAVHLGPLDLAGKKNREREMIICHMNKWFKNKHGAKL